MNKSYKRSIHWFRRDLRLSDNTALSHAVGQSEEIVAVYILSSWKQSHNWTGPGRQAFLCGCLESLQKNVEHAGGELILRTGDQVKQLEKLIKETEAEAVFLNRDPDPFGQEIEKRVKSLCREIGIDYVDYQDAVLHEKDEVLTGGGDAYKVYTPYSKNWFKQEKPEGRHTVRTIHSVKGVESDTLPSVSHWGYEKAPDLWIEPGEKAARQRLKHALESVVFGYQEDRNDLSAMATSHLGADLRWGTLSVREVYHRSAEVLNDAPDKAARDGVQAFQKQLAWREFYMAILGHFPQVLDTDFNEQWEGLHWDDPRKDDRLQRWKDGRTGFPIVDAGMRQLRELGYMHNRARMITAMFLTKDLHIHWREGEAHFMQHLLDGEIANNNGGWQWSAGTGADAAPYFRIQNPWTQTERFDPQGEYIKKWVPELEKVDPKRFRKPPEGSEKLCGAYVEPMVDHSAERDETLRRFKQHKEG